MEARRSGRKRVAPIRDGEDRPGLAALISPVAQSSGVYMHVQARLPASAGCNLILGQPAALGLDMFVSRFPAPPFKTFFLCSIEAH